MHLREREPTDRLRLAANEIALLGRGERGEGSRE
jgi:hypothetical protein